MGITADGDRGRLDCVQQGPWFYDKNVAPGFTFTRDGDSAHIKLWMHETWPKIVVSANGLQEFTLIHAGLAAAKGDLYVVDGSTPRATGILTVGTNGQVLTADSAEALGVKWADPAGGGPLTLLDDETITFGTDTDMTMFHESSSGINVINSITGYLELRHNTEIMLQCRDDDSVLLFYDSAERLRTTVTGVLITGSLSLTLVDAKGDLLVGTTNDTIGRLAAGADGTLMIADSVESTGLRWTATLPSEVTYSNTTGASAGIHLLDNVQLHFGGIRHMWMMYDSPTGTNVIDSRTTSLTIRHQSEFMAQFINDGAVKLYHDGTEKFTTTADGIQLLDNDVLMPLNSTASGIFWGGVTTVDPQITCVDFLGIDTPWTWQLGNYGNLFIKSDAAGTPVSLLILDVDGDDHAFPTIYLPNTEPANPGDGGLRIWVDEVANELWFKYTQYGSTTIEASLNLT